MGLLCGPGKARVQAGSGRRVPSGVRVQTEAGPMCWAAGLRGSQGGQGEDPTR